jgi:hypothetical protein
VGPYEAYHDVFRVGRLLLLIVLGGLFFALARGVVVSRRSRLVILALLGAAALSYPNFGFFHLRWGHIHYWDAYHYFIGPKYLPELGYTRLYEATAVAARELGELGAVAHVRDLTTYSYQSVDAIDAPAVRGHFSPERWQAFKRDVAFFSPRLQPWSGPLRDHGYNDPPPRALLLHLLLRWVPASLVTLTVLTSLDYVLLLVGYWAVRRAFGEIPAALTFAFFFLSFFARFDFIGGSILRWDWIVAVLVGLAAFARGSGVAAGLCLGYAVLARLFPVLFLVPLGMKWVQARLRRSGHETLASCLCVAVGTMLLAGVGLAALGATESLVPEYLARIRVHTAVPSINRVGLGSLLTVHGVPWLLNADGRPYVLQDALVAARPASSLLGLISALYLLVAVPLIRRASPLESVMYAVPLVFFALSPSGYYYSFLVLLVLLPWQAGSTDNVRVVAIALLTFNMAVSYAFELVSDGWLSLFYQASIQLGLFFVLWLAFEYVRLGARGPHLTPVTLTPVTATASQMPTTS